MNRDDRPPSSDGARLPGESKTMWRFLNWLYGKLGGEPTPPGWIEPRDHDEWARHHGLIDEVNEQVRERDEPAPSREDLDYLARGHVNDVRDAAEEEKE